LELLICIPRWNFKIVVSLHVFCIEKKEEERKQKKKRKEKKTKKRNKRSLDLSIV